MPPDESRASLRRDAQSSDRPPGAPSILGSMVWLSALAGVLVAATLIPATTVLAGTADDLSNGVVNLPLRLEDQPNAQTTRLLASNGELLAYFYEENRQDVPLKRIAPVAQDAILAIEDARFYEHGALDLKGTLRALVNNASAGQTQGGSSITQQLVKLTLVSQATTKAQVRAATEKSTARKIRELKLAISYEQEHTKKEILERYLNIAYFGDGSYGINSAAFHYFSRSPDKLNDRQAATLAGLVKNPVEFDPRVYPERALQRRNTVLAVMARLGKISEARSQKLQAQSLGLKLTRFPNGCVSSVAAFSCDYIRRYLLTQKVLGATVRERQQRLERGGLTIKSHIDIRMQKAANKATASNVDATDKAIGSIALVEPGTGKVRGISQSRPMGRSKKKGESFINFAVPTRYGDSGGFPAGSTFKMFTVAAALKSGIGVDKTFNAPPELTLPKGSFFDCEGGGTDEWKVKNSTSSGTKNMYTGTRESVNTYFAQLEKAAGLCNVVRAAESMGIKVPYPVHGKGLNNQVPAFTLGVTNVSALDMAAAYATPASGGMYCRPEPISEIADASGKVLQKYSPSCRRVLSTGEAAQINDILSGLQKPGGFGYARGTGLNIPSAAKTGTTQDNKAVWYVGYTPEISTAAMIAGASTKGIPTPLSGTKVNGRIVGFSEAAGSALAGPMWKAAMGVIQNFLTPVAFETPPKGQPSAPKKSTTGTSSGGGNKGRGRGGH